MPNFGPVAKGTQFQPLKRKNAPGTFLEQGECPRKIHPESYIHVVLLQVVIPMLQLLVPATSTESATEELHDMPVWDEQVARIV